MATSYKKLWHSRAFEHEKCTVTLYQNHGAHLARLSEK